jgi:glutathione S-transferase
MSSIVRPIHPNVLRVCRERRKSLTDEVDPYKKPQELLDLSPKGLVPALKLNNYTPPRALNESTVIMEYLEEFVSISPTYLLSRSRLES